MYRAIASSCIGVVGCRVCSHPTPPYGVLKGAFFLFSQADARAVTSAGLTPLHCLAMYNARRGGGGGADGADEGSIPSDDNDDGSAYLTLSSRPSSTASPVVSTPASGAATAVRPAEVTISPGTQAAPIATAPTPTKEAPPDQHQHHQPERESTHSTDPSTTKQQQQQQRQHQQKQRRLSVDRSVRAIADMLLDAGAEPDAIDADGNTPLLTAVATGGAALCELLLARGANSRAT